MAETAALSTGSAAPPSRQRRNWVPYALLLPGLLWLVVFFVLPMVTLGSQSLQEGNVDDGFVFTANFGIYVDAIQQYWPQFVRSFIYAGTATALALPVPIAPKGEGAGACALIVSCGGRRGGGCRTGAALGSSLPTIGVSRHR